MNELMDTVQALWTPIYMKLWYAESTTWIGIMQNNPSPLLHYLSVTKIVTFKRLYCNFDTADIAIMHKTKK